MKKIYIYSDIYIVIYRYIVLFMCKTEREIRSFSPKEMQEA